MNGIAPVGSAPDSLPRRDEELPRVESVDQPSRDVKSPVEVRTDAVKQAEKTTLNDFRYTGKGSFIDKVF